MPLTWRGAFGALLVWAAEYAVLGLIEDSAVWLKIATASCAAAMLFILYLEPTLRRQQYNVFIYRYLFWVLFAIVLAIYSVFVSHAIIDARNQAAITAELKQLYQQGSEFEELPFSNRASSANEKQVLKDVENWRLTTANYLKDNIDGRAYHKFINIYGKPTETERGLAPWTHSGMSHAMSDMVDNIDLLLKNLDAIIASRKGIEASD